MPHFYGCFSTRTEHRPCRADGDPLGQFAIIQEDENQWGLIVKESLDREAKDRFTLRVTATDGKFEAAVTVEIHVLDLNDNSPTCEQVRRVQLSQRNVPFLYNLYTNSEDTNLRLNELSRIQSLKKT